MKIIRYSISGFKSQYQSHHYNDVLNIINQNIDTSNIQLNDYQIQMIKQSMNKKRPFLIEHLTDFQHGIWVFIDGHKNNMSLNHLNRKVPCWEADISDDTVVYDVNWEYQMSIIDERCKMFGCYIPARSLGSLSNIKRKLNINKV